MKRKVESLDKPYKIGHYNNMQNGYIQYLKKTFIEVPHFTKKWFSLGFNDDDLAILENELIDNANKGVLMRNTGGIRKIRVPLNGKGKSGGARVCYVNFAIYEKIYLIDVFSKNEKENLSKEECNELKKLISTLKEECSNNRRRK